MPLTSTVRAFFRALTRCNDSGRKMPSTPTNRTPCAAPKYPPYTDVR